MFWYVTELRLKFAQKKEESCYQMVKLWLWLEIFTLREKNPNTEFFWSVFSRIQSKCGKIRTRKSSVFGHFSRSGNLIGLFFAELTQSKKSCLFLLVSKRDHLRTDISLWMHLRSDPWVFLEKSILKICSKFTREHRCQSVILMKLLYSFPDHLFIRKFMEGCFFHFDNASLIHSRSMRPF